MNTNMKIIVEKIYFEIKKESAKGKKIVISPKIKRDISIINKEKDLYKLQLKFFIDGDDFESPFNMDIQISGIFELKGKNKKEINSFLKTQAVQEVFPYLKSLVSNVTSSAMVPVIDLPIIDPIDFEDIHKKIMEGKEQADKGELLDGKILMKELKAKYDKKA